MDTCTATVKPQQCYMHVLITDNLWTAIIHRSYASFTQSLETFLESLIFEICLFLGITMTELDLTLLLASCKSEYLS